MEQPIFDDVIYAYSRAQAIEDGVLVDVTETARAVGVCGSVALTRAVYENCAAWPEGAGVWSVVSMAASRMRFATQDERAAIRAGGARLLFYTHKVDMMMLHVHVGPGDDGFPVITVMQPDED